MHSSVIAQKLSKSYDGHEAVSNLDFTVQEGECFGILGPNGAGKSTTMKMLYGRIPITSGDLNILGYDARTHFKQIKEQMGVIPQEDNLDLDFNVEENLRIYGNYFRIPQRKLMERVNSLLDFVQLQAKRKAKIDTLSGGMKRRLVIARALINNPKIVILDEPTTGLDPQSRFLVWERMKELKKRGITLLLTTHYMDEAAQLCDRLIIMDQGSILSMGSPQEMIENHIDHWVMEIEVAQEKQEPLLAQNPNLRYTRKPNGLSFYLPNLQTCQEEVRTWQKKHTEHYITFRPANLEDVFLHLAGHELRGD